MLSILVDLNNLILSSPKEAISVLKNDFGVAQSAEYCLVMKAWRLALTILSQHQLSFEK